jgi:hypothetical protein
MRLAGPRQLPTADSTLDMGNDIADESLLATPAERRAQPRPLGDRRIQWYDEDSEFPQARDPDRSLSEPARWQVLFGRRNRPNLGV